MNDQCFSVILQLLGPKAVTKNFRGSPHIDQNDFSVQYALAVGDFPSGGELCVEEAIFVKTLNGLTTVEVLKR